MFLRFLQVAARTALEFVFLLGLLVHLFQKYLLNTYYVLGSVLDDGRTVNKRGKSWLSWRLHFSGVRKWRHTHTNGIIAMEKNKEENEYWEMIRKL